MDFLPSVAKAPLRSSPGLAANSAWRVSICSASTVTSASTMSTASATGAAPSRTIARVAASVVARCYGWSGWAVACGYLAAAVPLAAAWLAGFVALYRRAGRKQ